MSQGQNYVDVCVDVWGEFAMFTRPESKVERTTYLVPTPSSCRGILDAIYSKPIEFHYEITQIDIMKPIRVMSLRRNEVTEVANVRSARRQLNYHIASPENRTQRMCSYLRDVYYRIHARMVLREDAPSSVNLLSLAHQFDKRVSNGKCFYQPYFGNRECSCYFSKPDWSMKPISLTECYGVMLYDVFDITKNIPINTEDTKHSGHTCGSFFNAVVENGIMKVPSFGSDELLIRRC